MELIEREAALTVIEQAAAWGQGHNAIYDDMRDIPSVDAAPVVTCGMCRYHKPIDFCELHRQTGWFNDQFCSRGARMDLMEGDMT